MLAASAKAAMTGVEPSVPGRVTAPLLVIAGTGDRVRSIGQMEGFVAGAPGRQLRAVPDAGHSVHWGTAGRVRRSLAGVLENKPANASVRCLTTLPPGRKIFQVDGPE